MCTDEECENLYLVEENSDLERKLELLTEAHGELQERHDNLILLHHESISSLNGKLDDKDHEYATLLDAIINVVSGDEWLVGDAWVRLCQIADTECGYEEEG